MLIKSAKGRSLLLLLAALLAAVTTVAFGLTASGQTGYYGTDYPDTQQYADVCVARGSGVHPHNGLQVVCWTGSGPPSGDPYYDVMNMSPRYGKMIDCILGQACMDPFGHEAPKTDEQCDMAVNPGPNIDHPCKDGNPGWEGYTVPTPDPSATPTTEPKFAPSGTKATIGNHDNYNEGKPVWKSTGNYAGNAKFAAYCNEHDIGVHRNVYGFNYLACWISGELGGDTDPYGRHDADQPGEMMDCWYYGDTSGDTQCKDPW